MHKARGNDIFVYDEEISLYALAIPIPEPIIIGLDKPFILRMSGNDNPVIPSLFVLRDQSAPSSLLTFIPIAHIMPIKIP